LRLYWQFRFQPSRRRLRRRQNPRHPQYARQLAQTLERIATGVVTIQIDSTRAFDTEWNTTAQATGFVIDAKRGLILTNRHVVTPGPVTAQAIFLNRRKCSSIQSIAIPSTTSAFITTIRRNCTSFSRLNCRCIRRAR